MPYIDKYARKALDEFLYSGPPGFRVADLQPGEMAYVLYRMLLQWTDTEENNFTDHAMVIGVLDCVKEEYRRRVLNPYEDGKIAEHGDVFP